MASLSGLITINALHTRQHVMAATVGHVEYNLTSSPDWFLPSDPDLELVNTSSLESTVGSVLTHVSTIEKAYPNVLDIRFMRRSEQARCPTSTTTTQIQCVRFPCLRRHYFGM